MEKGAFQRKRKTVLKRGGKVPVPRKRREEALRKRKERGIWL